MHWQPNLIFRVSLSYRLSNPASKSDLVKGPMLVFYFAFPQLRKALYVENHFTTISLIRILHIYGHNPNKLARL